MKIAVINGPNLNFLGIREPHIYGSHSLADLEKEITSYGQEKNITITCFQSNFEGAIIDFLQQCYHDDVAGIIINPGAYTHYSYAVSDAIKSIGKPAVEVHISHIHSREDFRKNSVTAASCVGVVEGFGFDSYLIALDALVRYINKHKKEG
ncbi:type II 3-dehydroquinate dehydratase [Cellulosilyticum sp. I15G10I2]|uniref:type II 3-dehydroquinate dehydratase n=1 Tax=Cellulosilyticum sp. I15G10I2 TaxID=1892843 RepID=UPI00085CC326|nr:type II 3-dehydroquinate dehydratase [Cellulosilyticum sp. I15G10I2]